MALLIQNAGEAVTRETLLLRVWGYSNQIHTRTLDVHIRGLRKKLGKHSTYIETIFSVRWSRAPQPMWHLSVAGAIPRAL